MKVFSLILMTFFVLSAQNMTEIFNDGFTSNVNSWPNGTWDSGYARFESGSYRFMYYNNNRYYTTINKYIDTSKDFEITMATQWMEGTNNNGFGLTFGHKDVDNNYVFTITANGYYSFTKWENGNYTDLIKWKFSSAIKQNINLNYITVKKEGTNYKFYINDTYVDQVYASPFFGQGVGFNINQRMRIHIYRLKIKVGSSTTNNYSNTITNNSNTTGGSTVFDENFDNNNNGWHVGDDSEYKTYFPGTWYWFEQKRSSGRYYTVIPKYFDESRDYELEVAIQWMNGDKSALGMTWGYKDPKNNINFLFTPGEGPQVASYYYNNSDDATYLLNWTNASSVKSNVNLNYLKVQKIGGKFKYYVNNTYIGEANAIKGFGNNIGFIVWNKQAMTTFIWRVKYLDNSNSSYSYSNSNTNTNSLTGGTNILIESFNNNTNGWHVGEDSEYKTNFPSAWYRFEHKRTESRYYSVIEKPFDRTRDYEIEVALQWMNGVDGYYFGMTWGYQDPNNNLNFVYTGSGGSVSGYRYENGSVNSNFLSYKSTSSIKKAVNLNYLKVQKIGSKFKFYVNNDYVGDCESHPGYGDKVGFMIFNKQTITAFRYNIKYLDNKTDNTYTFNNTNTNSSINTSSTTGTFLLEEKFKDNSNGWGVGTFESNTTSITGYSLLFDRKSSDGSTYKTIGKYIDETKDYEIETGIQWMSGAENEGFGLTFGYKDVDNNFNYLITANGYYTLSAWNNGQNNIKIKWTESSIVKQRTQLNTLKVQKIGKKYKFYLNNVFVNEAFVEPFFGQNIGFKINANQKVSFYSLKIKYLDGGNTNTNNYTYSNSTNNRLELTKTYTDPNTVFEDFFTSDNGVWPNGKWEAGLAEYSGGQYIFEHFQKSGAYLVSTPVNVDQNKSFQIEGDVKWISGYDNHGYGLVFGYKDSDNSLKFLITESGYYQFIETKSGETNVIIPWKTSTFINKKGALNKLKVKKIDDIYEFYINGTYVDQCANTAFLGNEAGFNIFMNQRIGISKLKIAYLNGSENKKFKQITTQNDTKKYYTDNSQNQQNIVTNNTTINNSNLNVNNSNTTNDLLVDLPKTNFKNTKAVAVIIGIDKYSNPSIPEVKYAKNDAKLIRKYLIEVLGYDKENILPQDENELMTFGNMKTLIKQRLPSWLKPDGSSDLFIYYSGHGAPSMATQEAFFVPFDCDPNFVSEDNAYKMADFYSDIKKLKAKTKTIVIDACFSGQSGNGTLLINNASPLLLKNKQSSNLDDKTILFQSSQADQVSNWYPEKENGMFTYFFLKGLKGEADKDKDGLITGEELEKYINDENDGLPYFSKRKFSRQQNANIVGKKKNIILQYKD